MLFHKVFMHNLVPQCSIDKEFKVMEDPWATRAHEHRADPGCRQKT